MKNQSVKKGILLNTIYQVLSIIIPFITTPYISRVLGPDGVGAYSYTHSLVTYFTMFAALGTITYGAREISRKRDNKMEMSKTFWEIEILTIITSLVSIVVWIIFSILYKSYTIYMLILTMFLVNTMFDISWLYVGLEKFKYTVSINSIFKILGVILLFTFIKNSNDLYLYIFIVSFNTLLGTLSLWMFLPKVLIKVKLNKLNIKHHFKETMIYFVPTVATSVYTVLDKTLLGIIVNDFSENGYYEQATKVIDLCKTLTFTSLNLVLGSRISYLYSKGKYEEIKDKISNSIDYILFMSIGIIFGLLAISDVFVIKFFGENYSNVSLLLKLLSPVLLIIGISNCLGSHYYNPAGLRKQSAKYIIIGCLINLIMNLLLIPHFRGVGAIIGTLSAELVITILYLINCNNYLSLETIIKKSYKKIISGLIMLSLIIILKQFISNGILFILISVLIGGLSYGISLLILKDSFIYNNIYLNIREKLIKNETV